jgi:uncharacterized membrane protein
MDGRPSADRLVLFSDAVVAIAITLLALELPVPVGHTAHQLWASARGNFGSYLAFAISFAVVAAAWSRHYQVFRYAEKYDPALGTLDLLWLATIILTPFATKLLIPEGHQSAGAHAFRFGFYALLQIVSTGTFVLMVQHMVRNNLQSPDAPNDLAKDSVRRSLGVLLGFSISIPVFLLTSYAWVLWFLVPFGIHHLRRLRRKDRNQALSTAGGSAASDDLNAPGPGTST